MNLAGRWVWRLWCNLRVNDHVGVPANLSSRYCLNNQHDSVIHTCKSRKGRIHVDVFNECCSYNPVRRWLCNAAKNYQTHIERLLSVKDTHFPLSIKIATKTCLQFKESPRATNTTCISPSTVANSMSESLFNTRPYTFAQSKLHKQNTNIYERLTLGTSQAEMFVVDVAEARGHVVMACGVTTNTKSTYFCMNTKNGT